MIISKKEARQIKKIKGKVRGVVFKTDVKYVESRYGAKGVKKIQEEISKIEPKFDYKKIKNTEWYPVWWRILSIVIIKNLFDLSRDDLFQMGQAAPSNSFVVKVILRYFVSFEKTCREAATYWGKHYSVGNFKTAEFNKKEKRVVYELSKFKGHPDFCTYLSGYFKTITELTNKSQNIKISEEKCAHKGDKIHRFVINW